jgi:hypothetical protein
MGSTICERKKLGAAIRPAGTHVLSERSSLLIGSIEAGLK